MTDDLLHNLQERVKELTALHGTARIIQDEKKSIATVLNEVVALLPPAWQYPEITSARISYKGIEAVTPGFAASPWRQDVFFRTRDQADGRIEVFYAKKMPDFFEGPFLKEERDLINSLAEMLRSYFQHQIADAELKAAHDNLEQLVAVRTAELQTTNAALQAQIAEYQKAERKIAAYQTQLRHLASELSLTEARERRTIAADLHDHVGQALAFIKMNVSQFRGNAVFCGFENEIDKIISLLDQTITYTRSLTSDISPPVLYELGLDSALDWLADQFKRHHKLTVKIRRSGVLDPLAEEIKVMLFKSVQELLTNTVKHARADKAAIAVQAGADDITLEISDNGCGFDVAILDSGFSPDDRFGLFSIKERLRYLGGSLKIQSAPGKGTAVLLSVPRHASASHEN
jgi:signal transduction histidine kinase